MMKKYIYYSTLFSIATEMFTTYVGIDLKLFYLIVLTNFFLLLFSKQISHAKGILFFYFILIVSGITSIALKTNELHLFLSQFVGIYFISLYFFNFFKIFQDQLKKIYTDYVWMCFYIAIIGIPLFLLVLIRKGHLEGFHSILAEPAHYATFVFPAFFYSYKNKELPRKIYKLLLFTIIMSGSSLALLGLGLSLILFPNRVRIWTLFIPFIVFACLLAGSYFVYPDFRTRVDDTVTVIQSADLTGANLSTYALLSNMYISIESFVNNPVSGSGLGSHEKSHGLFIEDLAGTEAFSETLTLNSKDANSLFLRVMSDMGMAGLLFIFYFIVRAYNRNKIIDSHKLFSKALLLYFFCKLFREGHYFSPEMYFFIFAYYFSNERVIKRYLDKHPENIQYAVV